MCNSACNLGTLSKVHSTKKDNLILSTSKTLPYHLAHTFIAEIWMYPIPLPPPPPLASVLMVPPLAYICCIRYWVPRGFRATGLWPQKSGTPGLQATLHGALELQGFENKGSRLHRGWQRGGTNHASR